MNVGLYQGVAAQGGGYSGLTANMLAGRQYATNAAYAALNINFVNNTSLNPGLKNYRHGRDKGSNNASFPQGELAYRGQAKPRIKRQTQRQSGRLRHQPSTNDQHGARCLRWGNRVHKVLAHRQMLNEIGKNGLTALMSAARDGCLEQVEKLLSAGADINIQEPRKKRTALIFAVINRHDEVAERLLNQYKEAGQAKDVRYADKDNISAIMYAKKNQHENMAAMLFIAGDYANYMIKREDVVTAIQASLFKASAPFVEDRALPEEISTANHGPDTELTEKLMSAERDDDIPLIDDLLKQNADINAIDMEGKTGLIRAAERGSLQIVMALLERGADAAIADKYHKQAIDYAIEHGHTPIVEILRHDYPTYSSATGRSSLYDNNLIGFGMKIVTFFVERISHLFALSD